MSDFLISRDDLRSCRIAESEPPELDPGQALLRLDCFGLTSNNVTYAVFGDAMSYWSFFPAEPGWGRMPVWGFRRGRALEAEGIESGARIYGYLPVSSHLVVTPERTRSDSFIDASPHRAELPPVYQLYTLTAGDDLYRPETEDIQMLLLHSSPRPSSSTTSWRTRDTRTAGRSWFRALRARRPSPLPSGSPSATRPRSWGPRRRATWSSSRVWRSTTARLLRRDRLARAGACRLRGPVGRRRRRMAVHTHFGDELGLSMAVGLTHWEELGSGQGTSPGRRPPCSSLPTAWSSAPETGGCPSCTRASPRPGIPSATGRRAGSRWFAARASSRWSVYLDVLEGRVALHGPRALHRSRRCEPPQCRPGQSARCSSRSRRPRARERVVDPELSRIGRWRR